MPLMGSLYIGASGLQHSQNALNTTAHNLSNVDTKGYTRQQVQLGSKSYVTIAVNPKGISNLQYGLGVSYTNVKQVRDIFLDKAFRKESGRSMFYEVSYQVLERVEHLLGELSGETFQGSISNLWTAVQEVSKDPTDAVVQRLLVQRASEFIDSASAVYDGLVSQQDNLNQQIKKQVEQINEYGKMIVELNKRISAIEAGNIEKANDLRDTRNRVLDELSKMVNMTYKEDMFNCVSVQIEGVDFIKGDTFFEMAYHTDTVTGFHKPYWPVNATFLDMPDGSKQYIKGGDVFDLSQPISSDLNTDIGGLKAMLLARGDKRADYTDITNGNYDEISQSILMNIQAEFDQLIHSVATAINDVLAQAAGVRTGNVELGAGTVLPTDMVLLNNTTLTANMTSPDGTIIPAGTVISAGTVIKAGTTLGETLEFENVRFCMADSNGYMRGQDGSPLQMFSKITTDAYQKITNAAGEEIWVYIEEDPSSQDTLYSVKHLQMNQELLLEPAKLSFRLQDGSEDKATVEALKKAFTDEKYTLNPNVQKKSDFINYYKDLVSQVANSGFVFKSIYTNQVDTVEAIEHAREQVVGVSSDEELSNMIRFQNGFNASSRYINAISEMLEHLIMTLGR